MLLFIICLVFLISGFVAAATNPDIFSPGKIFLFYFLLFYSGIIFTEVSTMAGGLILLVLLTGLGAIIVEGFLNPKAARLAPYRQARVEQLFASSNYAALIWIVSAPSIVAQLFMIQQFGGIEGYVSSIALRVQEWSGYGWARVLIGIFIPLNLAYFAIGLSRKRSTAWWLIYLPHFLTLLGMGLLSGSRSSLLTVIAMQIIVFHYMYRRISWWTGMSFAGGLVLSAMVLGVIRETIKIEAGQVSYGATTGTGGLNFSTFYYGIDPLEIIVSSANAPLADGSTFFSLFTNAIPRTMWPDKPDSGGVFFTQNYAGDAWLGLSNLTPTFVGEWIINFGLLPGVIGFTIAFSAMLLWLARYYFRVRQTLLANRGDAVAVDLVLYIYTLWTIMALVPGEFTNVVLSFVISQLIPLLLLKAYLKRFGKTISSPQPSFARTREVDNFAFRN